VTHVPAVVRQRDREIGGREPVLPRYERITFEKALIAPPGQPMAAFICPGHPLLDAVIDLTLERHRDLLRRGTVLVDDRDPDETPRVVFSLKHAVQDADLTPSGERRVISRRMLYVAVDRKGTSSMRAMRRTSTTGSCGRTSRRRRRSWAGPSVLGSPVSWRPASSATRSRTSCPSTWKKSARAAWRGSRRRGLR
jgi:hypothetical protein